MDALIDLSWRIYPATALVGLGAAFLYRGLRKVSAGLKSGSAGSSDMASFVLGFRLAVIGIALAGLGVAWIGHVTWLLVLSLVFGGEEILESTAHLAILRRWGRRPTADPAVKAERSSTGSTPHAPSRRSLADRRETPRPGCTPSTSGPR